VEHSMIVACLFAKQMRPSSTTATSSKVSERLRIAISDRSKGPVRVVSMLQCAVLVQQPPPGLAGWQGSHGMFWHTGQSTKPVFSAANTA
jgi:hypothetical protein